MSDTYSVYITIDNPVLFEINVKDNRIHRS